MNLNTFQRKSRLSIFAAYYKPHIGLFILDLVCALLVAAIDVVYPLITRYALNSLLPGKLYTRFFVVIAIVTIAYLLHTGLLYIITFWGHGLGVQIEADMRQDLFTHLQQLSFDFYDTNRTGHILSRVTSDLFEITELAHHGPEDVFISVITFVGAFLILFNINWMLSLVLLVMIPLTLLFAITQRKRMSTVSKEVKERTAGINADIESSISGARVAKAFANESYEVDKFQVGNEKFKQSKKKYYMSMSIFFSGMDLCTNLFSVAVIALGGVLIMGDKLSTVDLLIFSMYVSTFLQPVRKLTQFVEQFTTGMAGFNRFIEIMRLKPSIIDNKDAKPLVDPKGEIRFEDVTFSYGDEHNVLEHVNLEIPAQRTLALVGPSGGGKTTLCHLIPRFYDVSDGKILIDGNNVLTITLESLRHCIGIVSQDVFLFAGTIRDNIRYGDIHASDEEVIEAARRARIYDFIQELPEGLDTQVGERGVRLSGGQKQRISIARIFLKNPPVLILDEATSALDTVTERQIQESFDELSKDRTTIIIAHRLSTVRRADEIVYIDETGIREQGTHNELLQLNGVYTKLYQSQFEKQDL